MNNVYKSFSEIYFFKKKKKEVEKRTLIVKYNKK